MVYYSFVPSPPSVAGPAVVVSQVPTAPSPLALPLFLLDLSEFVLLSCGLCPASGLFGYSPLIAALLLSHM